MSEHRNLHMALKRALSELGEGGPVATKAADQPKPMPGAAPVTVTTRDKNSHLGAAKAGQERRVLHPVGRHRARDERLPGVRPRRLPRQGDPASVRRPGVDQLHQVLRAALHGLRPQEADLDVVRARQQPGEASTTSRRCSSRRARRSTPPRPTPTARSSSWRRRTSTATASSTSTTSSGSTSKATATSAAPR